jgi:phosphatidylglycerophosphate synthase
MADYQPKSRRPIAQVFRRTADEATRLCVRLHISPDTISYLSIVAALAAAICFGLSTRHPSLLIIAPLLCFLRLWFNMLDGMVALGANKASLRGEVINELPDRISDLVIFAGVAHSGWMHVPIGYWTAILALLTAYVGLLGQAIGGGRQFGGIMSKPWRMVVLAIGAWITFLVKPSLQSIFHFSIFDWCCLAIIGGCLQTIVVRLNRIFAAIQNRS